MNILYDHQFFSVFPYSGITRYLYEITGRIAKKQTTNVSLFMGWHFNKYPFSELKNEFSNFFSRRRRTFKGSSRLYNWLNDRTFPIFARHAKPDIYHQTYYDFFLPSFKQKRIVTIYDMTTDILPEIYPEDMGKTSKTRRISADESDGIIAISESTKRDIVNIYGIPPEKIEVIYLANSLHYEISNSKLSNTPYLLYVGQRCKHKNFETLFSVYTEEKELNRNFRLICFGGTPWTDYERKVLQKTGLENQCLQVTGDDYSLSQYYKNASLLVYPSLYEGFGMPLLEAMHYGCPVVASNSSCLPEILGGAGLLFFPTDKNDLIKKIKTLINDTEVREYCRKTGLEQEKKFSWDRCANETFAYYKKIVD